MKNKRIIPKIEIFHKRAVNTRQFAVHKYVGDPLNTVRIFCDKNAHELIIQDVGCSKNEEAIQFEFLELLASEATVPICYGGGIKNEDDALRIVGSGFEKILVNSLLFEKPNTLQKIASKIGNSSIIGSVDYRIIDGRMVLYSQSGQNQLTISPEDVVTFARNNGVGELSFTCIDVQGSMTGMNPSLTEAFGVLTDFPFILSGGVGSLEDIEAAFKISDADAIAAGSFFIFFGRNQAVLPNYIYDGETLN